MKYTESQTIGTQRFAGWGTPPFLTHNQWEAYSSGTWLR